MLEREKIILRTRSFSTNDQCYWGKHLFDDILAPVKINNWILVCTDKDNPKAQEFIKSLLEVGSKMGIQIVAPKTICLIDHRTDTYVNRIREEINVNPSVCIFLVLPYYAF